MLYDNSIRGNKRRLKLTWNLILMQIPMTSRWKDITHWGTWKTWRNTGVGEKVWGQTHSRQFDFTPHWVVWNLLVWGIAIWYTVTDSIIRYSNLYVFHLTFAAVREYSFALAFHCMWQWYESMKLILKGGNRVRTGQTEQIADREEYVIREVTFPQIPL